MNRSYRVLRYLASHGCTRSDILREKLHVSDDLLNQLADLGYISSSCVRKSAEMFSSLLIPGAACLSEHRQSVLILIVSMASALSSLVSLLLAIL